MRIDGQCFYPERHISEVIASVALTVVQGKDGRQFSDYDLGRLQALAGVAADLGLVDLAGRLDKVWSVASKGQTRDLERALLAILCEV